MKEHKKKLFWGLLFVIIGLVFLLNNFGFLPWSAWATLLKFWPLLIVFSGLEMFFGTSDLAEFLITLLIFFLVGYIFWQIIKDHSALYFFDKF